MRIEKVKNFITKEECLSLNDWTIKAANSGWLSSGITTNGEVYTKRLTSRIYPDRFTYPQFVRDLSLRVRNHCGISTYPLINGHGRDGVVVSYTTKGGNVYPHRDPKSEQGLATLRCNILTQKEGSGASLFIDNEEVPIEVGELHCYLVSEHTHYVTENTSDTPRIMWMFGAHVPAEDWNSGHIKLL